MHVNCEPRLVWENVVMTGSNCVHPPSDAIDDVTLGSDSDYVTLPLTSNVDIVLEMLYNPRTVTRCFRRISSFNALVKKSTGCSAVPIGLIDTSCRST